MGLIKINRYSKSGQSSKLLNKISIAAMNPHNSELEDWNYFHKKHFGVQEIGMSLDPYDYLVIDESI